MQFEVGQKVVLDYTLAPVWNGNGIVTSISDNYVGVKMTTGNLKDECGGFPLSKGYVTSLEPAKTEKAEIKVDGAKIGIGGAPTRATTLPEAAADRKKFPIASGFVDYFPDAIAAISHISYRGNQQHNPDKPLHWDRSKSADEADTMMRHFLQRGTLDTDGVAHSAKMAWRALALLQKEIEESAS